MTLKNTVPLRRLAARRSAAAFTLIEIVASLVTSAILMVGLASVLSIGLKAATPNQTTEAKRKAAEVADLILTDVSNARSFGFINSHDIEFQVPGRSEQNSTDSIRYRWQGNLDQRLWRSINGAPFHVIADQVIDFALDYSTRQVELVATPISEVAEGLLLEHRSTNLSTTETFVASRSNWIAQSFQPVLHPEAIAWNITQVSFYIQRSNNGQAGQFRIRIHEIDPTTGKPALNEVSSVTVETRTLPVDFQWTEFQFSTAVELKPCTPYALVIAPFGTPGNTPRVEFQRSLLQILPRAFRMTTSNSGGSWTTPDPNSCLRFQVFGTMKTQTWK
jgi:hypothetical protein